jgi:crotonobetainyl-CoA:carnitine CoA-transferase CaiB-like acyl-CoA transferase
VAGLGLVAGIMTALYNRTRTGKGEVVKTSLYGTAIWTMGGMIIQAQPKYGVNFPMRREWEGALSSKYKCKDGEWFMLVVLDYARDADKVYKLLGITEEVKALGVVDWQTRVTYNVPLMNLMQEAFLKKDLAEWCELFRAADIVSGAMPHFKDVSTDEQAWANHYLEDYPCRNGETCILPRQPISLRSAEIGPARQAPMPGEQTDEVLAACGFSEAEIANLHACGAVK